MSEEIICLRLPQKYLRYIDSLVEKGEFRNRSDVIRHALALLYMTERAGCGGHA
jgi:Arc/MetJ-type ribon-helix-helix transcriptional regulator